MTTWTAGMKLTPARLNQPATGTATSTGNQTALGTTETVSLTVTGMVFKAGWAYRAYIRTAVYGTANAQVHFRLRKTNTAGADWGEYGRVTCVGASLGNAAMVNGSLILVRSAGTDLTADVALTATASAAAAGNLFGSAVSPRSLVIVPVGDASAYAGVGVDVT